MERIYSIDSIKGIAIINVVFFHVATYGQNGQEVVNLWQMLFPRFVLPYFFIVSGFLFGAKLKNNVRPFNYFKGYIFNLVILFVGWYFFYSIYDLTIRAVICIVVGGNLKDELISFFYSIPKFSVIYYGVGNTAYHLWYLTALIWSIVILYIFINFKKLNILLPITFILNIIGLFGQIYSGIFHLSIDTRDALFFGLFYVTLGGFISFHFEGIIPLISKIKSINLIYLFLLSCFFQMGESFVTIKLLHGTKGGIGYYLSTIPLTLSLFTLVLKNKSFGENAILTKIGKNTVGIYVIHMLFISLSFWCIHFLNFEGLRSNFVFKILLTLVVFFLSHYSYILTQSIRKRVSNMFWVKLPSIITLRLNAKNNKIRA